MKRNALAACVGFVAGGAVSLLVVFILAGRSCPSGGTAFRTKERTVYESDGRVREAQFSLPTWAEYYDAIARESGFMISTEALPEEGGVSISIKNLRWEDAVTQFFPEGFEVVKANVTEYHVQKIRPNKRPDGTAAKAPPSNPSQGVAVPHP